MEIDIEIVMERAVRAMLKEFHDGLDEPDSLVGIDLTLIDKAGAEIDIGWAKVPAVPRIGDRFNCTIEGGYITRTRNWDSDRIAECTVTSVVFDNSRNQKEFCAEVTITENT